jgi:hypothetical protein
MVINAINSKNSAIIYSDISYTKYILIICNIIYWDIKDAIITLVWAS